MNEKPNKEQGQAGQSMKEPILLVDDDDIARRSTMALLTTMGYKALLATGGKEAVELYKQNREEIDLVLLDVIMPEMDGVETYKRLKEIEPGVKVLLMSGYTTDEVGELVRDLLERGCGGFLQKPFSLQNLKESIMKVLGKG
jgi:two-component system cell cycle sensor histidine kinase/response regulator CckA